VSAIADCRSGASPSAEGVTADRATHIVKRMERLGSVKQRSPTECLKYLKPAACGEDTERATLEAAPHVTLVTIPGAVFFLPDEAPQQTAAVIATALSHVP